MSFRLKLIFNSVYFQIYFLVVTLEKSKFSLVIWGIKVLRVISSVELVISFELYVTSRYWTQVSRLYSKDIFYAKTFHLASYAPLRYQE